MCLIVELLTSIVAQAQGGGGLGHGSLPAASLGASLAISASIAVLWRFNRFAIAGSVVLTVFNCTFVSTGEEVLLLVIIGVVSGTTARPRQLAMVFVGVLAYGIAFGFCIERRKPGVGWEATVGSLAIAAAGLLIGLVARWLLKSHFVKVERIAAYRCENAAIRLAERNRLADELRAVVITGITGIADEIDANSAATATDWRKLLNQLGERSQTLLTDLRTLLKVLRGEPPSPPDLLPTRRLLRMGMASVRIVSAGALILLAGHGIVTHSGSFTEPDLVIRTFGLIACTIALWCPLVGAALAFATLLLSLAIAPAQPWDAISLSLLCLIGAVSLTSRRRIYLIVSGLISYGVLLYSIGRTDAFDLFTRAYVITFPLLVGLAIHHFRQLRTQTDRQQGALAAERESIGADERTAVARELHDIVAHQLSMSTMHVMATSLSEDAATLAGTTAKVRSSTEAARSELALLLCAMRGADSERADPGPIITPLSSAAALTEELAANGFML